jgi:hypothetical protein
VFYDSTLRIKISQSKFGEHVYEFHITPPQDGFLGPGHHLTEGLIALQRYMNRWQFRAKIIPQKRKRVWSKFRIEVTPDSQTVTCYFKQKPLESVLEAISWIIAGAASKRKVGVTYPDLLSYEYIRVGNDWDDWRQVT